MRGAGGRAREAGEAAAVMFVAGEIAMGRTIAILTGSLLVALMPAVSAFAAEVTREEYKRAAEPICKSGAKANERILAGVQREVRKGKLKPAAAKFARASRVQARTLRKLEALPRPEADEARLTKWLAYLKIEADLFARAGRKLKAGDKPGAEHIITKLVQNGNKANVQVLPFGFHYCRLNTAKF